MADTKNDWIKNRLRENNYSKSEVYDMFSQFQAETDSYNWREGSYTRAVRQCYSEMVANDEIEGEELEDELIKLEANKQRVTDKNNYLRKVNRENYRQYNLLEEMCATLDENLKNYSDKYFSNLSSIKEIKTKNTDKKGILCLSDLHINEIITPSYANGNAWDLDVLCCRMRKYISRATKIFKNEGVKELYVFCLGDFVGECRRIDKKMALMTSSVNASMILVSLLSKVFVELSKSFKLNITFVVGNESRISSIGECSNNWNQMSSLPLIASENWDWMIWNTLKMLFADKNKNIKFIMPNNIIQSVVEIPISEDKTFNALITHGHILKGIPNDKTVGNILQDYAHRNIRIDAMFIGHYHSSRLSSFLQMCGTMKGGDAWTSNDCGFVTRAVQNIFLINDDGSLEGIGIDLQNYNPNEKYILDKELEIYNDFIIRPYTSVVTIKNLV